MRNILEQYDSLGDPCWPLSQLRNISAEFMRSLSASYRGMGPGAKLMLVRLMLYEALRLQWQAVKHNENEQRMFEHVLDLMRAHEVFEDSSMEGARLLTATENPITLTALDEGYDTQLSFRYLSKNGSVEAKMEMRSIVRPNYEAVRHG